MYTYNTGIVVKYNILKISATQNNISSGVHRKYIHIVILIKYSHIHNIHRCQYSIREICIIIIVAILKHIALSISKYRVIFLPKTATITKIQLYCFNMFYCIDKNNLVTFVKPYFLSRNANSPALHIQLSKNYQRISESLQIDALSDVTIIPK